MLLPSDWIEIGDFVYIYIHTTVLHLTGLIKKSWIEEWELARMVHIYYAHAERSWILLTVEITDGSLACHGLERCRRARLAER